MGTSEKIPSEKAPCVLVVDDEPGLLLTLAANLELEGLNVLTAPDGESALKLVRENEVDLVLTDVRMPGMNGVDLSQAVHRLKPEVPVVLMTAFAADELIQRALEGAAFTVVPKPFDVDKVVALVGKAMSRPVVLVVDDDRSLATSTAEALQAAGIRAQAVFDGEAALQAVKGQEVDVCVLDLVMPGMDGAETAAQLFRSVPEIAIIAVSGHDVVELLSRVASLGAYACMRKPVGPQELARKIGLARAPAGVRR